MAAKECKRVCEHVVSLLLIKTLEAAEGKPLRIFGLVGSIVTAFLSGKKTGLKIRLRCLSIKRNSVTWLLLRLRSSLSVILKK